MKLKGIVRALNDNGRVTLPKEWRKDYGIEDRHSTVELIATEGGIFLKNISRGVSFAKALRTLKFLKIKECAKSV